MNRSIIITIAMCLSGWSSMALASNDQFLYGACKPYRATGFYRCLSADEQIVYTELLPSREQEAKWRIAYLHRRAHRPAHHDKQGQIAQQCVPASNVVPETHEKEKLARNASKSPCDQLPSLIDAWSTLAMLPGASHRGSSADKGMDALELQIGKLTSQCR